MCHHIRLRASLPLQLEEWRSLTGTVLEQLRFVRFVNTRNPQTSSSARLPSSASSARSLKTSRPIFASSPPLFLRSRKHQRPIWLVYLRTQTFVQSTPSVWLSCQRISSLLDESAENALRMFWIAQPVATASQLSGRIPTFHEVTHQEIHPPTYPNHLRKWTLTRLCLVSDVGGPVFLFRKIIFVQLGEMAT